MVVAFLGSFSSCQRREDAGLLLRTAVVISRFQKWQDFLHQGGAIWGDLLKISRGFLCVEGVGNTFFLISYSGF